MKIKEFSQKTGLSIDTLRYYDKFGLLSPKRNSNIREYDDNDLIKYEIITKLRIADFTLKEIFFLFNLDERIESPGVLTDENFSEYIKCLDLLNHKFEEMTEKENKIHNAKEMLKKSISKLNILIGEHK